MQVSARVGHQQFAFDAGDDVFRGILRHHFADVTGLRHGASGRTRRRRRNGHAHARGEDIGILKMTEVVIHHE